MISELMKDLNPWFLGIGLLYVVFLIAQRITKRNHKRKKGERFRIQRESDEDETI